MQNNGDLDFCPTLKEILSTGCVSLGDGTRVAISGTSTLNNIRTIRHALASRKPLKTMEIGLAYGASALTFLATHAEIGRKNANHTAIDPYQSTTWRSAGIEAINAAGYSSSFSLIEQESSIALPNLLTDGFSFGVIYIDGSHVFEDVFVDFFYCARLLDFGGLLLFDDSTDKHVRKVLSFIDSNYSSILERVSVGPRRTLKQKVGHLLGVQQLTAYQKVGNCPRSWDASFSAF